MHEVNADEAAVIALQALAWTLADERRAQRLLAMTGLDAGQLRATILRPATQRAVLEFLLGHEPDLVACAEAIDCSPETLAAAARTL